MLFRSRRCIFYQPSAPSHLLCCLPVIQNWTNKKHCSALSNSLERFSTKQTVPPHHPGFCNACNQMEFKNCLPICSKRIHRPAHIALGPMYPSCASQDSSGCWKQAVLLASYHCFRAPSQKLPFSGSCPKTQRNSGGTAADLHRYSLLSPSKGHLFPCLYVIFSLK